MINNTDIPEEYSPIGCDHKQKKGQFTGFTAFQFFSEESGSGPDFSHCVSTCVCMLCGEIRRVGHRTTARKIDSLDEIFDISHPDAVAAIVKACNYMNSESDGFDPFIRKSEAVHLNQKKGPVLRWYSVDDNMPESQQEVLAIERVFGRMVQKSWMEGTDQNKDWFKKTFSQWTPLPLLPYTGGWLKLSMDCMPAIDQRFDGWLRGKRHADCGAYVGTWSKTDQYETMRVKGFTHWMPIPEGPESVASSLPDESVLRWIDAEHRLPNDPQDVVCIRGDGGGEYFYQAADSADILNALKIAKEGAITYKIEWLGEIPSSLPDGEGK